MPVGKFTHGTITCCECGRITRDTGKGESDMQMCAACISAAEWANAINDGDATIDDVPENERQKVNSLL